MSSSLRAATCAGSLKISKESGSQPAATPRARGCGSGDDSTDDVSNGFEGLAECGSDAAGGDEAHGKSGADGSATPCIGESVTAILQSRSSPPRRRVPDGYSNEDSAVVPAAATRCDRPITRHHPGSCVTQSRRWCVSPPDWLLRSWLSRSAAEIPDSCWPSTRRRPPVSGPAGPQCSAPTG